MTRVSRLHRLEEIKNYFDGIQIASELTNVNGYQLSSNIYGQADLENHQGYDMFVIDYLGTSNKTGTGIRLKSTVDGYELRVTLKINISQANVRNRFKGIFKQYDYNYNCTVNKERIKYEVRFKEDDFTLEKLAFINKFFLEYMK